MSSDFLLEGQVSGLWNMHPLLNLDFLSTLILPLHVVSCCVMFSNLKRKSSSCAMDGFHRTRRRDKRKSIIYIYIYILWTFLHITVFRKSHRTYYVSFCIFVHVHIYNSQSLCVVRSLCIGSKRSTYTKHRFICTFQSKAACYRNIEIVINPMT